MTNLKNKIVTKNRWLTLSQAADALGLSKRTLWRRIQSPKVLPNRVINFQTMRHYVLWSNLQRAPILSLGKAAKLCDLKYETLRRWARRGRLRCWRFRNSWGEVGYRRTSLFETLRALRRSRRKSMCLRLSWK